MKFKANSMKDAVLEAEKIYRCDKKQLKVYVIKSPGKKFLGMVRTTGEYDIEPINQINEDLSKQQSKDGCIEIVSGKAMVTDPLQEGRYASIIADDPQIDVYVNGEKVFGAAFATGNDRIEFKSIVVDPVTKIKARLSKDKMQAILEISKTPGKEYFVKDAKRSNVVFIRSDYKEIQPPAATLDQCLVELKKLNVDIKFVNIEKIKELINELNGGSAVVAEGKRLIDGLNSKIKYLFKNTSYRNPDFDAEKKVDLMNHTIIPSVNVGDVLAVKITPVIPGRDGITVTGTVLKAKEGKDIPLKVGKGTALLDNDTKVVAVSSGRPEYKKGVISVIPTLVISHDVDVSTGNVHFDGDILIKGNISENLKVSTGGDITVFGNIYHANVYAKGNIRVHGNIINSKVSAGLNVLNYLCVLPKLKQIIEMVKAFQSVVNLAEASKEHEDIRRKLLQVVINKKNILDNLMKDIQNLIKLFNDEETNELIRILEDVKRTLTGINAQCIENTGQIKVLYEEIVEYVDTIEGLYGNQADMIFENGQNSFIQANGNIVIADRGCYQTNLMAKKAILFKKTSSIVRGGLLIAGKCIKMGIVGAPSGVSTYCRVLDNDGKIDAVYFYNNTVLNINDKITVIESNTYGNETGKKST